jgi:hypothetical protein
MQLLVRDRKRQRLKRRTRLVQLEAAGPYSRDESAHHGVGVREVCEILARHAAQLWQWGQ